jgi:hypothetical protein
VIIPIDTRIALLPEKRRFCAEAKTRWTTAKVRRMSWLTRPADCELCGKRIAKGEWYRDAGIHHRAHDTCVAGGRM